MYIYVVSRSSNRHYALNAENIIAVCATGPCPFFDAKSYARDYVLGEGASAFIYEVHASLSGSYKLQKEAVFVSSKP